MSNQNLQSNASVVANKTISQVIREMINAGNYSSLCSTMECDTSILFSLCFGTSQTGAWDLAVQSHLILGENPDAWVLPKPMEEYDIVKHITVNLPRDRFGTFGDLLSLGSSKQRVRAGVDFKVIALGSIFQWSGGMRAVARLNVGSSFRRLELVRLRENLFEKGTHVLLVKKNDFPVPSAPWGVEG
ncbi:MAG: hypothetical protein WC763_02780 [Candidatus Paceibacterota bacterium]|jgi:hypothetical protein